MSIKYIYTFFFLFYIGNIFSQTKTLTGFIADSTINEAIPFAHIRLLKQDKIISNASTDFDGKYSFKNIDLPLDSLRLEIRSSDCYISKNIHHIEILNDSTIKEYYLSPLNCDKIIEKYCKFHNDSCDIYEVKYMWDLPRTKKRKSTKIQSDSKVIYLPSDFYDESCCCKKTWYCRTHTYRY